jgi:hypothetical protein
MSGVSPVARRATVPLAALVCALAAVVALELLRGPGELPPAAPGAGSRPSTGADSPSDPPMTALAALDAYLEVSERPLFVPTRRPIPQAETATARGPLPRLKGVVLNEDLSAALFEVPGETSYAMVPVGERYGPWLLEAVAADHVILSNAGAIRVIELEDFSGGTARRPSEASPGTSGRHGGAATGDEAAGE